MATVATRITRSKLSKPSPATSPHASPKKVAVKQPDLDDEVPERVSPKRTSHSSNKSVEEFDNWKNLLDGWRKVSNSQPTCFEQQLAMNLDTNKDSPHNFKDVFEKFGVSKPKTVNKSTMIREAMTDDSICGDRAFWITMIKHVMSVGAGLKKGIMPLYTETSPVADQPFADAMAALKLEHDGKPIGKGVSVQRPGQKKVERLASEYVMKHPKHKKSLEDLLSALLENKLNLKDLSESVVSDEAQGSSGANSGASGGEEMEEDEE